MTDKTAALQAAFDNAGDVVDLTGSDWLGGFELSNTVTLVLPKKIITSPAVVMNFTQPGSGAPKPAVMLAPGAAGAQLTGGCTINYNRGAATAGIEGVVRSDAPNVTIEDVKVRGDCPWSTAPETVRVSGIRARGDGTLLRRNDVANLSGYGIICEDNNDTRIEDNRIAGFKDYGLVHVRTSGNATGVPLRNIVLARNQIDMHEHDAANLSVALYAAGAPGLETQNIVCDQNWVVATRNATESGNGSITLRDCTNYRIVRSRIDGGGIGISVDHTGYGNGVISETLARGVTFYGIEIAGQGVRSFNNVIEGLGVARFGVAIQGANRVLTDIIAGPDLINGCNTDYFQVPGAVPVIHRPAPSSPRFRACLAAQQTGGLVPDGYSTIQLNQVLEDNAGGFSPRRYGYLCKEDGLYLVFGNVGTVNGGPITRGPYAAIAVNGRMTEIGPYAPLPVQPGEADTDVGGLVQLDAGDVVTLTCYTPAGVVGILGAAAVTFLDIVKISD